MAMPGSNIIAKVLRNFSRIPTFWGMSPSRTIKSTLEMNMISKIDPRKRTSNHWDTRTSSISHLLIWVSLAELPEIGTDILYRPKISTSCIVPTFCSTCPSENISTWNKYTTRKRAHLPRIEGAEEQLSALVLSYVVQKELKKSLRFSRGVVGLKLSHQHHLVQYRNVSSTSPPNSWYLSTYRVRILTHCSASNFRWSTGQLRSLPYTSFRFRDRPKA